MAGKTKLILVFLLILLYFCCFKVKEVFGTSQAEEIKKIEAVEKTEAPERIARRHPGFTAQNLRDPFQRFRTAGEGGEGADKKPAPVSLKKVAPSSFLVQGVIWGGAYPQAIINNKVVKIGDNLEEAVKIIDIEKSGVTVLCDGEPFKLPSPASFLIKKSSEEDKENKY